MFKNEFQGGPYVEVFSSQGKDPLMKWKLSGGTSSFSKVYDKEIKSYCHVVEGATASTKMLLPKDAKQLLVLIQRFFVIQLYVSLGQDFSVELGICDMSNNKRRIVLSTSHKEVSVTPLHAKIPLAILKKSVWLNLCFDMVSFVGEAFKGQTFKSLDSITISASCKLRKIFTLKTQPLDNTDDDDVYHCCPNTNDTEVDHIPTQCQFHKDVRFQTQVINMNKLRHADYKTRGESAVSRPSSSSDPDLNASRGKDKGPTHIAFGSRVRVPSSPSSKKPNSAGRSEASNSAGHRSNRTPHTQRFEESPRGRASKDQVDTLVVHSGKHNRQKSDPGTPLKDSELNVDKDSLSGSRTWAGGGQLQSEIAHKPHPPRDRSKESAGTSRRIVKVRPSNSSSTASSRGGSGDATSRGGSGDATSRSGSGDKTSRGSGDATSRGVYDKNKYSDSNGSKRRNRNESESSVDTEDDVRKLLNGARERLSKKDWKDNSTQNISRYQRTDSMSESDDMLALSGGSVSLQDRNKKQPGVRNSRRRLESFSETDEKEQQSSNSDKNKTSERTKVDSVVKHYKTKSKLSEKSVNNNENDSCNGNQINSTSDRKLYTFNSKPRTVPASKDSKEKNKTSNGQQSSLKIKFSNPQSNDFFGYQSGDEGTDYRVVVNKDKETTENKSPRSAHLALTVDNVNKSQQPQLSDSGPRMRGRTPQHGKGKKGYLPKLSKDSSQSRSRMSLKRLKEISKDDPRLSSESSAAGSSENRQGASGSSGQKVTGSSSMEGAENRLSDDYDWRNESYSSASSLEARMLQSLQRQQLEEALEESSESHMDSFQGIDADVSDSSDDSATTNSTWQRPAPPMQPYDYMEDAHRGLDNNPLMQSNPREWSKMFSPPIIPVSERGREELAAVHLSPNKDIPTGEKGKDDSDDELDLLYDPCLNCYFDPKTHKYYELA
ncbi:protein CFAP20DC-like [Antedon mediterranea]|uniref:protein CFAP20DC-like n=1 Tax=Antedon mediterranea TaxID=105859 RepID=UPI003AF73131